MSIKRMTAVWEHSTHKGANLLLLLALADNANDDGYCWPSIDTLARRTRTHRATVIRGIERLETTGEVIAHRSGRGNRYLVVVGMVPEAVRASLEKHLKYSTEQCDEALKPKEQQPREKSQNATTDSDGESSRRMRPEKSQNATPVVASCAIEPSLNVSEPSPCAPAPKNGAVAARAAEPKAKTPKSKTPNQLMFDAICAAFSYDPTAITKSRRGGINRTIAELLAVGATPADIPGLHAYCAREFERFGPNALSKNWPDYKASRAPRQTRNGSASAPAPKPRPDCEQCGGTGLIIAVYPDGREETVPCPDCRAAAESARKEEAIHA